MSDAPEQHVSCLMPATSMARPRRLKWLIPDLLPLGSMVFLAGDEAIGKSAFATYIASVITSGRGDAGLGIPAGEPRRVLLYSTEDEWCTRTGPVLEACGANPNYLRIFTYDQEGINYPRFTNVVEDDIREFSECYGAPALIIVDNFLHTLPVGVEQKRPEQLQGVLTRWRKVARSTGATVLCVHHTNRTNSANSRDQWAGSSEYRKASRMALLAKDNEDETFTVGVDKSNVTGTARAVVFRKTTIPVSIHYEDESSPSTEEIFTVEYVGESDRTIRELVEDKAEGDITGAGIGGSLEALLRYLLQCGGASTRQAAINALKPLTETQLDKAIRRGRRQGYVESSRDGITAVYRITEKGRNVLKPRVEAQFCHNSATILPPQKQASTCNSANSANSASVPRKGAVLATVEAPPLAVDTLPLFAVEADCVVCGKPLGSDSSIPGVPLCGLNDDNHRAARSEYDTQGLIPAYLTVDSKTWRPEERMDA